MFYFIWKFLYWKLWRFRVTNLFNERLRHYLLFYIVNAKALFHRLSSPEMEEYTVQSSKTSRGQYSRLWSSSRFDLLFIYYYFLLQHHSCHIQHAKVIIYLMLIIISVLNWTSLFLHHLYLYIYIRLAVLWFAAFEEDDAELLETSSSDDEKDISELS